MKKGLADWVGNKGIRLRFEPEGKFKQHNFKCLVNLYVLLNYFCFDFRSETLSYNARA